MTPDTLAQLAAERQRERLLEAGNARLAATVERRHADRGVPCWNVDAIGRVLAARRGVLAR
ncbi:MAG TPA: hypothetical protein VMK83_01810 [Gaiellaceae bacterium]|nr:hypothetical protein [Gaiellaceae bacterium]